MRPTLVAPLGGLRTRLRTPVLEYQIVYYSQVVKFFQHHNLGSYVSVDQIPKYIHDM